MDDQNSTEPLNAAARVEELVAEAERLAGNIAGNDIMFTMGGGLRCVSSVMQTDETCARLAQGVVVSLFAGDFDWTNAFVYFRNIDKLIHHANKVGLLTAAHNRFARCVSQSSFGDRYRSCTSCSLTQNVDVLATCRMDASM